MATFWLNLRKDEDYSGLICSKHRDKLTTGPWKLETGEYCCNFLEWGSNTIIGRLGVGVLYQR